MCMHLSFSNDTIDDGPRDAMHLSFSLSSLSSRAPWTQAFGGGEGGKKQVVEMEARDRFNWA
jgi:hypothetical protein